MNIVFMGTPDFAVPSLEAVCGDHTVSAVFTRADKPVGRGMRLAPPPVKEAALARGLTVYQPETLRDGNAAEQLRALAPDLIVVVAYGRILPPDILAIPQYGCVNVHASLLPRWRGAAPIQRALMAGDETTGVCTMYMAEGLDTGDVILSRETPIGHDEHADALYPRLAALGAELLTETLVCIERGAAPRVPQDDSLATLAPPITRDEYRVDLSRPPVEIYNQIRALTPRAYVETPDGPLRLCKATLMGCESSSKLLGSRSPESSVTLGGKLALVEVQPAGRRRMPAADFLRGHRPPDGLSALFGIY